MLLRIIKVALLEFITMSRKPGIAHDWIVKYYADVYNYDKVVLPDGIDR